MSLAGVPVLREGNVIVLASTTLEVAEACSGIRSLISLLTLGIVFGYFLDGSGFRVALALATIPLAIVTNALRVAGTGIAAHYWSPAAAQGFFHTFSGWLVFAAAFAMLVAVAKLLRTVLPEATGRITPQVLMTRRALFLTVVFLVFWGWLDVAARPADPPSASR